MSHILKNSNFHTSEGGKSYPRVCNLQCRVVSLSNKVASNSSLASVIFLSL